MWCCNCEIVCKIVCIWLCVRIVFSVSERVCVLVCEGWRGDLHSLIPIHIDIVNPVSCSCTTYNATGLISFCFVFGARYMRMMRYTDRYMDGQTTHNSCVVSECAWKCFRIIPVLNVFGIGVTYIHMDGPTEGCMNRPSYGHALLSNGSKNVKSWNRSCINCYSWRTNKQPEN